MLSDQVKHDIQSYYSQFLERRKLKPRYGQKLMVAEIARVLGGVDVDEEGRRSGEAAPLCVVEAGTGTGKTIAYLIATLPIARALGKQVVIATATVALQEQLINKDIPELLANTDMDFSFALAKGRGRYLCLSRLDNVLRDNASQEAMLELYGLEPGDSDELDKGLYQRMQEELQERRWHGDRDAWPENLQEREWRAVSVEHGQCSGSRCSFYKDCYFFRSRQQIQKTDCIVANQDLVLADLSLGGGAILPHPEDTIYIFDEAHHLPLKGLSHFSHFVQLKSTLRWLDQGRKLFTRFGTQAGGDLKKAFGKADAAALEARSRTHESVTVFEQFMQQHTQQTVQQNQQSGETGQYTFSRGIVPPELRELCAGLYLCFNQLTMELVRILDRVRLCMEKEGGEIPASQAQDWYAPLGSLQARGEAAMLLWLNFSRDSEQEKVPWARWLSQRRVQNDSEIILSCSPILAAEALTDNLWQVCFAAVLTSATLSALNSFDFLSLRSGLPPQTHFCRLASPFNVSEAGVLQIPQQGFDAGDSAGHTNAVTAKLPELLRKEKGALVLFSSRRQMQDVLAALPEDFREKVLSQDDHSKQQLLEKHKARVDAGKQSVIFGLASLSEGIDLPGNYCTHVVIAKLPFSVPDNPIDLTLGEWLRAQGRNPFTEVVVPEASMRLVQASGRLLRSEQDKGTITILDDRLLKRPYGAAILDSLPAYTRAVI